MGQGRAKIFLAASKFRKRLPDPAQVAVVLREIVRAHSIDIVLENVGRGVDRLGLFVPVDHLAVVELFSGEVVVDEIAVVGVVRRGGAGWSHRV